MNVSQVIAIFDEERPNQVKASIKMRWLKQIETKVLNNLVLTHELPKDEEGNDIDFSNYFETWGPDFELYIPEEYVDVYKYFLDQKTCYKENDYNQFNAINSLFTASWLIYSQYYNRTHMPNQVPPKLLDHTRC